MFLQVDYNDLPAGTPVVSAEKSSAHHQASVMVGTQVPTGYYKLAGDEGPATLAIPRFEGIVADKHPTDPTVVGPFICKGLGCVLADKLPAKYVAYITPKYDYPYCTFNVCVNVDSDGVVVRVEMPKPVVINYPSEVEKLLNSLRSAGKEFEVEYMD